MQPRFVFFFFSQSWCIAFYVLSCFIANYSTFSKDKKNFWSQLANRSTASVKHNFPWLLLIYISLLTIYFCFAWSIYYLMIDCSHCNTTSEHRPRSVERDHVQIWNLVVHCHCVGADFFFLVSHPLLPSFLFLPLFPSIPLLLLFSFPWLLSNPFSLFLSYVASLALVLTLALFLSSLFSFSLILYFLRKSSYQKSKLLTDIQCSYGKASRALRAFTCFPAVCIRLGGALTSLHTTVSLQNVDISTFLFSCFIHLCNRDLLRVFYVLDARTLSLIFILILERRQKINRQRWESYIIKWKWKC